MSGVESTTVDGLDLPALNRFFAEQVPDFRGRLTAELLQGGRSNLTYRLTDGVSTWVLRRPPLGGLTPSAHDMRREYQVVAALADSDVPVARTVALSTDAHGIPFSVVEYVDGSVFRTQEQLHVLPAPEIHRCGYALIDVLARLHAVDPGAVGLGEFGRPDGYLARQVRRWHGQWQRVATRPLADLDALQAQLAETCPAESGAAIVHGDFRIDNAILSPTDPASIRAMVDWEMATLGDPLADLGLHLVYRDPAFAPAFAGLAASSSPRLPTTDELAHRYATRAGRSLDRLAFYLALGYYKIAIIAEGIHARYLAGHTVGDGFEPVGQVVPPLVAAGLRAITQDR